MAARVIPGIDPAWLERLYRDDPTAHALAVWDRAVWPEVVEFRTLVEEGRPTAYLLLWRALPGCPVVHWGGTARDPDRLLEELPERPFLAIVPPELEPRLRALRGPLVGYEVRLRERPAAPGPAAAGPGTVRRLRGADAEALRRLAAADGSSVTDTYLALDPDRDWVVGGFEGDRLAAVARAEVRLPEVWHVSGVYTAPADRGRGRGAGVVGRLLSDAAERGARTGLFVRADNPPALRLYDRLGFSPGVPRSWIDAGADRPP